MTDYEATAKRFKVLSDPTRLEIVRYISSQELCACQLLEHLSITQPTLSHHMKVLVDAGLVSARKEKTWMHYRLNLQSVNEICDLLREITGEDEKADTVRC